MPPLDDTQSEQLAQSVAALNQLLSDVDEAGAEVVLDELYLLITVLLERFPQLDVDED